MSKSAIKYINSCVSGKTADLLIGCINNDRIRKNWRNADVLARFLVDTVANAYQCEDSTTFEDNGHTDMDDAISSYIEANLCDWDQESFLASSFGKQTAQEISANLDEWRTKNAAFEAKQRIKKEVFDADTLERVESRMQPCSAARNNAHYYELLVAKRQRKGQVVMTTIAGAYEYIVNDAVAGDMVKSVDLYHREILMRDGSWLQLVEASHLPHGFYVKTQDKLA